MLSWQGMKGRYRIFILLDTEPGKDEKVAEKLLEYDEIIEVHTVSGAYDLLAVLEISLIGKPIFSSIQELSNKLVQKIRKLDGVLDTNTIVPFHSIARQVR